jgi:SAM-dependent methyltransferase
MNTLSTGKALFDLETVFEVEDYLFAYGSDLTPERSDAEVAALVKLLDLHPPLRILDLACGFGRHTNRLAKLGYTVTGMDYMPGFIELARQDAARMAVQVDYRQGDMRGVDFKDEFDLALLLFTSFGYFEDDDNRRVIRNAAAALKPGGRLVFDIPHAPGFIPRLPPSEVIEKGQDLLINRYSFDEATKRFHNRRILIRDGLRKDKPYSVRMYNTAEITDLLNEAGLVDHQILDEKSQPVSPASRRMTVIARKP